MKEEELIFLEERNILGTIKFNFPREGKYSMSYFKSGKTFVIKFKLLNGKYCKETKLVINQDEEKLRSSIVTIKKESYSKTNNLYIRVFNDLGFIGFIRIIKGEV